MDGDDNMKLPKFPNSIKTGDKLFLNDSDKTIDKLVDELYNTKNENGDVDSNLHQLVKTLFQKANPSMKTEIPKEVLVVLPKIEGVKLNEKEQKTKSREPPNPEIPEEPEWFDEEEVDSGVFRPLLSGCYYEWKFVIKKGEIQTKEIITGHEVFVKLEQVKSVGVGPLTVSLTGLYCVYVVETVLIQRWQLQQKINTVKVVCPPNSQTFEFPQTPEWVKLEPLEARGKKNEIKCEWSINPDAFGFADKYAKDHGISRGTDETE